MGSEIKPICGITRVKLSDVIPLATPFTLFVFPTTYCNFKCNYCGHSLGLDKMKGQYNFEPQNMSMVTFKRVIEQVKIFPNKLKVLSLTGHGEPLLNKNLPLMIKIAKEANIAERIEIISNASLLTPNVTDSLIEAGLDTIRVSLQGLSADKYKEGCGFNIDFDAFLENIKYFYNNKKNCKLFIKVMDVSLDKDEDEKFYNLFFNISDRMFIEKCRPVYDGVQYSKDVFSSMDRYGREHKKRNVCPLPFFMLGVFPNGDVEPCDTIYKPVILGNIHDDTLLNMWQGNKLREFRMMQLEKNRNNNCSCSICYAPDDVAHPEDDLDNCSEVLLRRFK